MAWGWNPSTWDWGSIFNALPGAVNTGINAWKFFDQPDQPRPGPAPPQQQPMPVFEMPDFSEMMLGFQEMMGQQALMQQEMIEQQMRAQQEMMNTQLGAQSDALTEQQKQFREAEMKSLARNAASARKSLQSQGITWDPNNPNVGAGGASAIASQMGIPPEELLEALKQFGGQYGFTGYS